MESSFIMQGLLAIVAAMIVIAYQVVVRDSA